MRDCSTCCCGGSGRCDQSLGYPHLERATHTIDISLSACEGVSLSSHASVDVFSGVDSNRVNFHHTGWRSLLPFHAFEWPYLGVVEVWLPSEYRRCPGHQPVSSIWHRSSFFSSSNAVFLPSFGAGTRHGGRRRRTYLKKQRFCSNWTTPR